MNENVREAIRLIKMADDCLSMANRQLERVGVQLCVRDLKDKYLGKREIEIHVFNGIENLGDISNRPPFFEGEEDKKYKWIKIDGVNFVEINESYVR